MTNTITHDSDIEAGLIVEPYLHLYHNRIYNPLKDRYLFPMDEGYRQLRGALLAGSPVQGASPGTLRLLRDEGWLVPENGGDLSERFYLKYVSIESSTVCNQACYFCPVSINPRDTHLMPDELYESILRQLSEYKDTIASVFMINYNEPTADRRFPDQVRAIKRNGLPVAVNTNATGLTPARVDEILEMGGIEALSVNMSTMNRERYRKERGHDHINIVMKNMDYLKDKKIAKLMDIAVLGKGDEDHKRDFRDISAYFAGSFFNVKYYEIMDRAGYLTVGNKPPERVENLCGCDNLGSRPLQHIHITPYGKCVLCCEDYDENYVVGDLTTQSVKEVLEGPEIRKIRRWVYGLEKAPDNFICSKCVFSMPERSSLNPRSLASRIALRIPGLLGSAAHVHRQEK